MYRSNLNRTTKSFVVFTPRSCSCSPPPSSSLALFFPKSVEFMFLLVKPNFFKTRSNTSIGNFFSVNSNASGAVIPTSSLLLKSYFPLSTALAMTIPKTYSIASSSIPLHLFSPTSTALIKLDGFSNASFNSISLACTFESKKSNPYDEDDFEVSFPSSSNSSSSTEDFVIINFFSKNIFNFSNLGAISVKSKCEDTCACVFAIFFPSASLSIVPSSNFPGGAHNSNVFEVSTRFTTNVLFFVHSTASSSGSPLNSIVPSFPSDISCS
mmetsp:Transcript_159/g.532  ORF Transcript_159/g.532 Transcript_159/m.532 type:complete len:268 (+) Transcript_159:463-1266(+)